MADHADANPSKGAGKYPRLSITRASKRNNASATVPLKRKSRVRDSEDTISSKVSKVDKTKKSQSSTSNQDKSQSHTHPSKDKDVNRNLRKRKHPVELASSSEESCTEPETETEDDQNIQLPPRTHAVPSKSRVRSRSDSGVAVSTGSGGSGSKRRVSSTSTKSSEKSQATKVKPKSQTKSRHSRSRNRSGTREDSSKKRRNSSQAVKIEQTTSEEESISSRLRSLPCRAAATSQWTVSNNVDHESNNRTSGKSRSRSPKLKQQQRETHKKTEATGSSSSSSAKRVHSSSSTSNLKKVAEPSKKSTSHTSTGENSRLPRSTVVDDKGLRYRLRSRSIADGVKEEDKRSRKGEGSGGGGGGHGPSSKTTHRSKGKSGSGDGGDSKEATGSGTSGGRGDSTATSSNTTGSCASSRCGRGGGPSSAEGPSSATVKSGEPGMNSSSGNQQQSSSSRADQPDGAAAAGTGASGVSSGGAASAASAFSRGLAMLSGETDADDGDMGRLQALLESRGLPPHLFGSLAPRMQQLLHRGISASSGNVTKAQQLLQGLQATGDEGQQLQAAIEMCQLLVMGNEDTLAGFPIKQTVPALIQLLSMEHNFDMMNHACRALTYMMEALPRSTPVVAEAVPTLLEKLQVIQCMDVAEQSLTALEMLSRRHAKAILQARGVGACLTFLDFFSIGAQRAALAVTANCMQNIHQEEFPLVADSLHFMATRLTQQDKKSVESVCLGFSRLVESLNADPKRLEEIASSELLSNLQQLLVVTPPIVSTATFIIVLRMLAQLCSRCPTIAVKLLEQNIVGTLSSLLLGSSTAVEITDELELVQRNPQELLEIVNLIAELLPKLPKDGIFVVNSMMVNHHVPAQDAVQWQWKDDRGQWNCYAPFDSRIIEAAHQSGEDEISLAMHGRTYTVDFLGMQQINEDTGTARNVQRKVNAFFNSKTGEGAKDKANFPQDERSGYLALHPDFSLPFLRPLFALLSEANTSSAGPAVRTSCLKTLLRIVHFLPSESLEKALKPQLVSNSLASMLGSSDLKIVVGAFQLCNLFMEKLQEEFCVHFRREGVFHQISRISSSEVVGPSPTKSDISSLLGATPPVGMFSSTAKPPTNMPAVVGLMNNLSSLGAAMSFSNSSSSTPTTVMNVTVPNPLPLQLNHLPSLPPPNPHVLPPSAVFEGSRGAISDLPNPLTSITVVHATSGSRTAKHVPESAQSSSSKHHGSANSKSQSGSDSSGQDKKMEEPQSHQSMYDPFKRKRISKRPIPTSRRLRQEDPGDAASVIAGNSGNPTSGTGSTASSNSGAVTKRGGKSGFFANLHPSRWTRGSGSAVASERGNNNNSGDSSHHSSDSHPGGSSGIILPQRVHNSNSGSGVSYKEQVKAWLKEQSLAFTTKYCKPTSSSGSNDLNTASATDGMPKLHEIGILLRQESRAKDALKDLRTIVVNSDISSFEINHSGLIPSLLAFLTDEKGFKSTRDSRLRLFINIFADCPLEYLSGDSLDATITLGAKSGTSALSFLVARLNSCLSQLEQFQVKVHEVPSNSANSRAAPTSALRFFNTHQLKCNLQRHPSCHSLRQWKGGPVKIDSLALVQTIERYLIAKGFGRIRESRDSADSEDDNSDDDIEDTLPATVIAQGNSRHKLQFLIGEQTLPYTMTVYQAIRQFGLGSGDQSAELDTEYDSSSAIFGSSGIWAQTHTIYYRPIPEDGSTSSTTPSGSKSKKSKTSSAKNSSKSKKDPLWNEGLVPDPIPPYLSYLTDKLPEGVTISDPCLPVLTLLRVIHAVCRFWRYLYWPVLCEQPLLSQTEFINTKVAAKAQRQLQDPVVIMAGNVPQWLQQIGVHCPFLFPFETRHMLFYSITFDRDRALQRLLDSVPELNGAEREDRITPRLDRRKRTISRDNILHHAEQLMLDFGSSRPLLEIQYENEVGTGLGPTLEFYALVSQELQKKELDLWHNESSVEVSILEEVTPNGKTYVQTSVGLFPKPLGKSVKSGHVSKVQTKFKFLGRFMAKAVMDSRMIDLSLSKAVYKWILTGESSMCLADLSEVDCTVARSIRQLVTVVSQKKKLEGKMSPSELTIALETLTLDGCQIDNLGLDFTLPGHPSIDLKKGGKDIPVTIHNLEEYIKLVCHWILFGGISRQMESWKEGFDSVFSSSSLKMFYPEEFEMVFCGANQSLNENWDIKTLMDCCRADHGYSLESKSIQFLFQIMASYNAQERRKFIQFVTGSPRLPVGGFKALQPQLTIVRKSVEGVPDSDGYLPSVMTCVNYLKLPDYSTIEIMKERLRVAVDEGQLSFHLS